MDDLQTSLDRSLRDASPFTRLLFDDSWDAARVAAFVNATRNITIATVTAKGDPHAAVVIVACVDGLIHFSVSDESVLARNLSRNPRIAFTVSDRKHAVMGRGDARLSGRSLQLGPLIDRLARVTEAGKFTPAGWDGLVYCIEVDRIFAN